MVETAQGINTDCHVKSQSQKIAVYANPSNEFFSILVGK